MYPQSVWDDIIKIIKARKLKKIRFAFDDPNYEGTKFIKCLQEECLRSEYPITIALKKEEHDAIFVNKKRDGVIQQGTTLFEISAFEQPEIETNDLISVVFDIETVVMEKNVFINDKIVSIVLNTTIVENKIDTVYVGSVDFNVTSWRQVSVKDRTFNQFSDLYSHLITNQYIDDETGEVINMIYCSGGEKEIVITFIFLLNAIRPHNLVTFNGTFFDIPFMIRAGFRYGINMGEELSLVSSNLCNERGLYTIKKAKKKFKNKGFIQRDVLDLQHNSFNAINHTDLYLYNDGSLNEVCKTKLGMEKVDLPHADIPKMVDSKNEKLLIYNVKDTELTTKLFFSQYFLTIRYYFMLEKVNSTFWDMSSSTHRSVPAYQAMFSTNQQYNFVQPALVKPARLHNKNVFGELIDFFMVHRDIEKLKLADSRETVLRYHHGTVDDIRKTKKKMKNSVIPTLINSQVDKTKIYTSKDLLCLLNHLSAGDTPPEHYKNLWDKYKKMFTFNTNEVEQREKAKFDEFMHYMITMRAQFLSPYELSEIIWKDYTDYKSFVYVQSVKQFFKQMMTFISDGTDESPRITTEFYETIKRCYSLYEPIINTRAKDIILDHLSMRRIRMELEMLPYDGAFIAKPINKINVDYPVIVVDIASQYPSAILALNMSNHTEIDLSYIAKHKLKHKKDFISVNHRRCDDSTDYTVYLQQGMDDYVHHNYTFFLYELDDGSRMAPPIVQYTRQINERLSIKKLIKYAANDEEIRMLTEMSNALKVDINSYYGVLGKVTNEPKFQPCVTAMGRKTIHNIRRKLMEIFKNHVVLRYGDTDSVFFNMDKTYVEILAMSLDEAFNYFVVVPKEDLKVLYEKTRNFGDDKSDYYKSCYLSHCIFETYVTPLLNESNPKQVKLEVEKVMLPSLQCSQKKYAAFIPLQNKTLTKGLSNASRVNLQTTKKILNFMLERLVKNELNLVELYHFIAQEILIPLLNGTIDIFSISKPVSHNRTKNITAKALAMCKRLQADGKQFMFDSIKETVINIEPIDEDDEWSVITVDQYLNKNEKKNYKLNIEKIMSDTLNELLTILATTFSVNECIYFELLKSGLYDKHLKTITPGNGEYATALTGISKLKKRRRQSFDNAIRDVTKECLSRIKRKYALLPSDINFTTDDIAPTDTIKQTLLNFAPIASRKRQLDDSEQPSSSSLPKKRKKVVQTQLQSFSSEWKKVVDIMSKRQSVNISTPTNNNKRKRKSKKQTDEFTDPRLLIL